MFERYLNFFAFAECPIHEAEESFAKVLETFPKRQTRRMSRLGILVAHVLKNAALTNCPLVYATRYTETRALEKYLDSFPDASPTQFQTSIHPGGIEQALILAQQAICEIIPLAGGTHLVMSALQNVFLSEAEEVFLIGGEETGTWLLDFGLASDIAFAFAASFSKTPGNSSVSLKWEPICEPICNDNNIQNGSLFDLSKSLQSKQNFHFQHPDFGKFTFNQRSCPA